jgi:hypothetical protein
LQPPLSRLLDHGLQPGEEAVASVAILGQAGAMAPLRGPAAKSIIFVDAT